MPNLVKAQELGLNAWDGHILGGTEEAGAATVSQLPFSSLAWQGTTLVRGCYAELCGAISALGSGVSTESRAILRALSLSSIGASRYQIDALEQVYTFREPELVRSFLERNSFLSGFLFYACEEISRYFPDSRLYLETFVDPELSSSVELILSVATNLDVERAADRLEALDHDWWLSAKAQTRGTLCITVEPI